MKAKPYLLLLAFLPLTVGAQSISKNAIGLRLGDSDGFGAEVSYQRALGRDTRLEANVGWRDARDYDAVKLTGLFEWVRPLDGNFNWYYGVGGGVGSVDFGPSLMEEDGAFVFGAGNLGIEYDFDIPLLIAFDIKPEVGILGYSGFGDRLDFDVAIAFRYQF